MSRIGKKQIIVPEGVDINIEGNLVKITGKFGSLENLFLNYISIKLSDGVISVHSESNTKEAKAYYGLGRALINNMVLGVSSKFEKVLIAEGVGYKFQLDNAKVNLLMGFSHPVQFDIPSDVSIKLESPTKIVLSSTDKQKVGLFASKIRNVRPPEPYKGKGIRYEGEKIRRKAGKTKK